MNMRNCLYIFLVTALLVSSAKAQQSGVYTNFTNNAFSYNPGFTGMENAAVIHLAHRTQWAGFKGAPNQQIIQFGTRLISKKTDTIYQKALPISNNALYKKNYRLETKTKRTAHAIGGLVQMDTYGPFSRINGALQYAYRFKLDKGLHLNVGAGLGVSYFNLDPNKISVLDDGDQVFDQYQMGNSSSVFGDLALGALLYGKEFYVGYATNQLLHNRPFHEQITLSEFQLRQHHMLSAGFIISPEKRDLELIPHLNTLVVNGAPISLDLGVKARFNSRFWLSINHRPVNALGFRAGGYFIRRLAINYSYELSTNGLRAYQAGSHEIGLLYHLGTLTQLRFLW